MRASPNPANLSVSRSYTMRFFWHVHCLEALSKQIRHLDEERTAVTYQAWFSNAVIGVQAAVVVIIGISGIDRGSGTWGPADDQLR